MCAKYRHTREIKLAKITVFFVFFLFAECAAGSCLSYGHACWGAHGKRSGSRNFPFRDEDNGLGDAKWFISKLLQNPPQDLRSNLPKDFSAPKITEEDARRNFIDEKSKENELLKSQEDSIMSNLQFEDIASLFDSFYGDDKDKSDAKLKFFKLAKRNALMRESI